jgi:hypothetical protein
MNSEELARYQSLSRHDMQNDLQILSMYVELGKEKELLLKQINRMSRRLQAQSHMFHRMPPAVAWELWATDVTWREAGVRHKIETAGDRADSFELRPGWERIFECLRKSGARYSGEASVHLTVSWTAPMPNLRVDVEVCSNLQNDGYATDPNYSNQLITLIEQNRLYIYDLMIDIVGNIKQGEKSTRVKTLQMLLNKYGYKLDIDGSFGKITNAAVKDFQTNRGFKVDGIVGHETITQL